MEMMKMDTSASEDEEVILPGFRFHPTDEELVGFYLRRKVEKKPIPFELIKQIDIYKFDPWDLPMVSNGGEREWYFFCKRGRKYRNSIRPNRVTGSGFWKATGIDKPIFSTLKEENQDCIGLKKSLVYYTGTAGKGTKTDWMMHEFRLPFPPHHLPHIALDAEVWTLCRILKRIPSYRKYTPNSSKNNNPSFSQQNPNENSSSKISSSFQSEKSSEKSTLGLGQVNVFEQKNGSFVNPNFRHESFGSSADPESFWNGVNGGGDYVFSNGSWDELRPLVHFAVDPFSHVYGSCI